MRSPGQGHGSFFIPNHMLRDEKFISQGKTNVLSFLRGSRGGRSHDKKLLFSLTECQ